jgi:transposase
VKPAQPPRSSTVKAPKWSKGGSTLDPQGFDAAKKVTGRKRHILVDTLGLLLNVVVHSAAMQDRDGALLVLNRRTRRFFPFIKFIFADAGYQGQNTAAAIAKTGTWKLTIVQRNELHRFVVLPKRWIVNACTDRMGVNEELSCRNRRIRSAGRLSDLAAASTGRADVPAYASGSPQAVGASPATSSATRDPSQRLSVSQ